MKEAKFASRTSDVLKQLIWPRNVTEISSPSGLCNDFKRIVLKFARLSAQPNRIIQEERLGIWIFDLWQTECIDNCSEEADFNTCPSVFFCEGALYAGHRCMRPTSWMYAVAGATQKNKKMDWLLVGITYECEEDLSHYAARMLGNSLVNISIATLPPRNNNHHTDRPEPT